MLKPIEPGVTTIAVWENDPALTKKEGVTDQDLFKLFSSPGKWADCFDVIEGQSPVKFVIGTVRASDLNRIDDEYGTDSLKRLFWECFLLGVRDIKGWSGGEVPKVTRNGLEYVDRKWLENNFGYGKLRHCGSAIGRFIYSWNNTQGDDVRP